MDKEMAARLRIGEKIAEMRKQQGIRQIDLANAIGLRQSGMARIENGKVSVGFDILEAIAAYFGCEVDFNKIGTTRPPQH